MVFPRRWEVSLFDLYTLQVDHKMLLPAGLMDVFLHKVSRN